MWVYIWFVFWIDELQHSVIEHILYIDIQQLGHPIVHVEGTILRVNEPNALVSRLNDCAVTLLTRSQGILNPLVFCEIMGDGHRALNRLTGGSV